MIVGRSMNDAFVKPAPPRRALRALGSRILRPNGWGRSRFPSPPARPSVWSGLRGAGHHTIGRAIFGETRIASGRLLLDGEPIAPRSPAEAMANGHRLRVEPPCGRGHSREYGRAREHLSESGGERQTRARIHPPRGELSEANAAARRFSIKAASVEQPAATLSGGNQQKVVVARWMEAHVRLLILEEPTIGVDVGAKADIYHLLQLSLSKGLAVLLISSDFEEVERICHRALVFSRGRVAAEIPARSLDASPH